MLIEVRLRDLLIVSPTIRPYRLADHHSLAGVIDTVCEECPWMATRSFQPTLLWSHSLRRPDCPTHALWVVEDQSHIVGWCRLFPVACDVASHSTVELGIGLLPAYRNHRIGARLMRSALEWLPVHTARVELTVHAQNAIARRLFHSSGFADTWQNGQQIGMEYQWPAIPTGMPGKEVRA